MLHNIPWAEIFVVLHVLVVTVLMVRVLYHQRNTGVSVAWILMLMAFPLVGAVAYLLIGEPRLGSRRLRRQRELVKFYHKFSDTYLHDFNQHACSGLNERYHGISLIAADKTGFEATEYNHLTLLTHDEEIISAIRHDIQQAKTSCLLAFYIIDPQGVIVDLLNDAMAAAQRGVVTSMLVDSIGSARFWRSDWPRRLRSAGITLTEALPIQLWRTFFVRADLRNHRKIAVIDQKIGYTGSFNLVDPRFFKKNAGVGQWVDVMMRCEGSLVQPLAAVFAGDMAVETESNLMQVQQWVDSYGKQALMQNLQVAQKEKTGVVVQVIPSAPEQGSPVIYDTIVNAIHAATRRIMITTPYFVPDDALLLALTTAATRGVEVTLIVPEAVDSKLVKYASRAYYPMLLQAGVKIALFKGGLLHAKTLTVDSDYTLFGTVNMDMRSFYLNMEISLAIYDEGMTETIVALQNGYLRDCEYIELKSWQARSKWWGLVENSVRLVGPLL
ncbi:cardiolipin synthase [Snodgrassella alvi]|uniref:cardiolipin synthase n=1 Tax=Snodgrassella alvi TaxID=1196083 RepID=UPI0035111DF7